MQYDHIHVTIYVNQFEQFNDKLYTGKIYMISKARVITSQDKYRPLPGNRVMNFTRNTKIKEVSNDNNIPRVQFEEVKTRVVYSIQDITVRINLSHMGHY